MKHWRLCSFQKSLHQLTYSPFKCFSYSPHFLHATKFFRTLSRFSGDQQTTTTLSLLDKDNFTPTSISYSKLLSACCNTKSMSPGMQLHAHIVIFGLSQDLKLQNQLINLYSKCQVFSYARKMVEEISESDVFSWSALISGYAQNGLGEEALQAFQEMRLLGVDCNEFTFPSVLKVCSFTKNLPLGQQIHGIVVVSGFERDVFVVNTLVVVYAKCGEFMDSRRLFNQIPNRNTVSWNALFTCYVQSGFFREAMVLFQEMLLSGTKPDEFSLSSIVNACLGLEDGGWGRKVHGYMIKLGYDSFPFSSNALVDMYAKLGALEDAIAVFEKIEQPDIVSWNTIIAGCIFHEYHDWALELLGQMRRLDIHPNMFTLSSALKGCAALGLKELGRQLHSCLIKMEAKMDLFVSVGLIDMYSKCDLMGEAKMVFGLMLEKDLIAWNAMITGHAQNGEDTEALLLFNKMYNEGIGFDQTTLSTVLKSIASLHLVIDCGQVHALVVKLGFHLDIYVVSSLIDSYGKCGHVEDAERIFEDLRVWNLVCFTSLISSYAQFGKGEKALKLFLQMQDMGLQPDQFVYSSLLNICANLSAYEQGKQLHVHILKYAFMSDIFAGNSLVNMYAKCGSIDDAARAFSEIPKRGIVSWSAMIAGLAQHGQGKKALHFLDWMLEDGVPPTHITLLSVLYACNHAGLVTEGKRYFKSMKESFGIEPMQEHYACMVDLLGRAGELQEAVELIDAMPFEANASVWGALLSAATIHKNVELGERAAEMLFTLEPEKSGSTHALLANVYASASLWDDVVKVRRLMKDREVNKELGTSWIEVKDNDGEIVETNLM